MHIIPLYFILYTDHHLNLFIPNSIRLLFIFYISFFYFGIKKNKFEKQSVYDRLQSFLVYRQQSDIMKRNTLCDKRGSFYIFFFFCFGTEFNLEITGGAIFKSPIQINKCKHLVHVERALFINKC